MVIFFILTHLIVGEESSGLGELSSFSRTGGQHVHALLRGVTEGEGLSVQWDTQHQLAGGGALLHPVVDRVVLKIKHMPMKVILNHVKTLY